MSQFEPIVLDNDERALLLDLLQQEQDELPTERHHTDRREYVQALEERKIAVGRLIQRLQGPGTTAQ